MISEHYRDIFPFRLDTDFHILCSDLLLGTNSSYICPFAFFALDMFFGFLKTHNHFVFFDCCFLVVSLLFAGSDVSMSTEIADMETKGPIADADVVHA